MEANRVSPVRRGNRKGATDACSREETCMRVWARGSRQRPEDIRARALEEINAHKFGVIAFAVRIRARQVVPPASNLGDLFPLAQYPITDGQMSCGFNYRRTADAEGSGRRSGKAGRAL